MLMVCGTAVAQPVLWVGANVGYDLTDHVVSGVTCQNGCPQFNGGFGSGVVLGVNADWFAYDHAGSSLTMNATTSDLNTKDQFGNVVPLVRQYTLALQLPAVTADLSAFYNVQRWRFSAGWGMGFLINPTWQSSAHIVSPGNVTYGNNHTDTTFFPTQSFDKARSPQFSIIGGVSYDIPLSKQWTLSPDLHATYSLTTMRTDDTWRELVVELGATVKFGFGVGENPPAPPPVQSTPAPPPPPPAVAPVPPLARLAIHAISADGTKEKLAGIRVNVQFVTEAFPLLPIVFFDAHATTLPTRYVAVNAPDAFATAALEPSPLPLHHNILNIIGERLRAHVAAHLTLHPYADPTTENADCDLAAARARTVQAYLTSVWHIDAARVIIKTSAGNCAPERATISRSDKGYADNRRVEIESDDAAILAPVERKQFAEPTLVSPPSIEFDPRGSDETGVRGWSMATQQRGVVLFADTGSGAPLVLRRSLADKQSELMAGNAPAIASMSVTGDNGLVTTVRDTLPVVKDTLDTEVERLSLTLFATSQDHVSPDDAATITRFIANIVATDSIVIRGYTDALGDTSLNDDLSARRADNVRTLIGGLAPRTTPMRAEGIGFHRYSPGIHAFALPEERFLSRTVQIEIRRRRAR